MSCVLCLASQGSVRSLFECYIVKMGRCWGCSAKRWWLLCGIGVLSVLFLFCQDFIIPFKYEATLVFFVLTGGPCEEAALGVTTQVEILERTVPCIVP